MTKWLAKRFRFTKDLMKRSHEQSQEIHVLEIILRGQKEVIEEYQEQDAYTE